MCRCVLNATMLIVSVLAGLFCLTSWAVSDGAGAIPAACTDVTQPAVLAELSGTIQAPIGEDGLYLHDLHCLWKITAQHDHRIRLNVTHLDMRSGASCRFDVLYVYDGPVGADVPTYVLCGDRTIPDNTIISTANNLVVQFVSDASLTSTGFTLQYEAIPEEDTPPSINGQACSANRNPPLLTGLTGTIYNKIEAEEQNIRAEDDFIGAEYYCTYNSCLNGATCKDHSDMECLCNVGYFGNRCQFREPSVCVQPKDSGNVCGDSHVRWYYNSDTEACESFTYHGCNGNDNRFVSREQCEQECIHFEPYDYCSSQPCKNGGTCMNSATGHICVCPHYYTGDTCEQLFVFEECSEWLCQVKDACGVMNDRAVCYCPAGFSQYYCWDYPEDACMSNPCFHGGECITYDEGAYYGCDCSDDYTGDQCQFLATPASGPTLFSCGFETNDLCYITQSTSDDGDWLRRTGPTETSGTGPNEANNGEYYMYIDANNVGASEAARIDLPALQYSGAACLTLSYFMYGADIGALDVGLSGGHSVFRVDRSLGNYWYRTSTTITLATDSQVYITATGSETSLGDIAIDDVTISQGECFISPCASMVCQNSGDCVVQNGIETACHCPSSHVGEFCELPRQYDPSYDDAEFVHYEEPSDFGTSITYGRGDYNHLVFSGNRYEYQPGTSCMWRIEVPAEKVIHLHFDYLHIGDTTCAWDKLEVLDSSGSLLSGPYCGRFPTGLDVHTLSSIIAIRFTTDDSTARRGRGFSLTYAAVDVQPSGVRCFSCEYNSSGDTHTGEACLQPHGTNLLQDCGRGDQMTQCYVSRSVSDAGMILTRGCVTDTMTCDSAVGGLEVECCEGELCNSREEEGYTPPRPTDMATDPPPSGTACFSVGALWVLLMPVAVWLYMCN